MLVQKSKLRLLCVLAGLCLSLHGGANAQGTSESTDAPTVETFGVYVPAPVMMRSLENNAPLDNTQDAHTPDASLPPPNNINPFESPRLTHSPTAPVPQAFDIGSAGAVPVTPSAAMTRARVALLLPSRSSALNRASDAVRAGFLAAHDREPQGIEITMIESGDAPDDVLNAYRSATANHDIVVGPLTRSGVTALIRSGEIMRPTIALTTIDAGDIGGVAVPGMLLAMGLSLEDEARQVAVWARQERATGTAIIVHTAVAWQQRVARAFATQWAQVGRPAQMIALPQNSGFLDGNTLQSLRSRMETNPNAFLFAALDANQTRQLRESIGRQYPLYGTSQINATTLPDRALVETMPELDGVQFIDMPWQLQEDHAAVMAFARAEVGLDQARNPDLERLYALGIDAARVARALAHGHSNFKIDGVTGNLTVRFDHNGARFSRVGQHARYRSGNLQLVNDAGAR